MTCILTTITKNIADRIDGLRQGAWFTLNDFRTEWDFEGRTKDTELTDNRLHVRVIVPRKWQNARRIDRSGNLEYIGAFDIDIRQKLGVAAQGSDSDIERDRLVDLVSLVEELHLSMHQLPPADGAYNLQWLAEYDDTKQQSEVFVAYSTKYLREQRQFYGVCRELFQVTS